MDFDKNCSFKTKTKMSSIQAGLIDSQRVEGLSCLYPYFQSRLLAGSYSVTYEMKCSQAAS